MIVYRLASKKFANDLSGTGAELTGGRWNYKGTKVVYTSDSRALCMAEIAVHTPIGILPKDYHLITIEIPDNQKTNTIDINNLKVGWNKFPYSKITQEIGEEFINSKNSLYLKVPSAVVQGDYNILINPKHQDFSKVKILRTEPFNFDLRLFK